VVLESLKKEQWINVTNERMIFSKNIIDVVFILNNIFHTLTTIFNKEFLISWEMDISEIIFKFVFKLTSDIEMFTESQFTPPSLSPISISGRKKSIPWMERLAKIESSFRKSFKTSNCKLEWNEYSDPRYYISSMIVKLGSLSFLKAQISLIYSSFLNKNEIPQKISQIISKTSMKLIHYIAFYLVFIEIGPNLFEGSYCTFINKEKGMKKISTQVQTMLNAMKKTVLPIIPQEYVLSLLTQFSKILIDAWSYYLLILFSNARDEDLKEIMMFLEDDTKVIKTMILELGDFKEISTEQKKTLRNDLEEELIKIIELKSFIKLDDFSLIEIYKSLDPAEEIRRETLCRIISGRQTKEVDKFFEFYKHIFLK